LPVSPPSGRPPSPSGHHPAPFEDAAISPSIDLESALNPEQLAAVTHPGGPQLVVAGAGSGKTRVITHRIAWLVSEREADPARIAAVTFTNKAAAEMRERVAQLLGLAHAGPPGAALPTFVGTFHRFALRLLRRYGERVGLHRDFAILDTGDQRSLVKQALKDEELSEKSFSPVAMLATISGAKNKLLTPSQYEATAESFFERRAARVYRRYQGLLQRASGVDFDDMIAFAVRLLEQEPDIASRVRWQSQHLLVDEYQDTNFAQLRLIQELARDALSLTAVGDEDQSIYGWRGAELSNILEFESTFPGAEIRKLERNYRSSQNILDASGALVANNRQRRGKRLWTDAGAGPRLELYHASDERDEARWVVETLMANVDRHPYRDMAVLVRTNAQTRALEEELLRQEVPYSLIGGTRFYERAEIKDLIAYLRLLRNPRDPASFNRIVNQPPRGIGRTTLDRLYETAATLGQPPWDVLYNDELGGLPARSATSLRAFRDLILDLQQKAATLPPAGVIDAVIDQTGFESLFDRADPDGNARLENIKELVSAAHEFADLEALRGADADADAPDPLTAFLDHVSLVSDVDSLDLERGVSVMTFHSAKGLEFPLVVISGLEDGLLPHFNSQDDLAAVEEERRLLYVGMTRAKERLILTCCGRRRIAGFYQDQRQSPFLEELPEELLDVTRSPSLFATPRSGAARGVHEFFGSGGGGRGQRDDDLGYEPDPDGQQMRRGSRVRHPTLGQGVVLEIEGSGERARITVFFDTSGKRKLAAKFANLEVL
jgi:DNA helicase-2/ATP-dependent DNA helicase PcrA